MYQIIHPTYSFNGLTRIKMSQCLLIDVSLIFVNRPAYTTFEKKENAIQSWMEYLEKKLMKRDKVLVSNWSMIKFLLISDYVECLIF
jgi:hypothetical protein